MSSPAFGRVTIEDDPANDGARSGLIFDSAPLSAKRVGAIADQAVGDGGDEGVGLDLDMLGDEPCPPLLPIQTSSAASSTRGLLVREHSFRVGNLRTCRKQ
jgi:hypothetical protein